MTIAMMPFTHRCRACGTLIAANTPAHLYGRIVAHEEACGTSMADWALLMGHPCADRASHLETVLSELTD